MGTHCDDQGPAARMGADVVARKSVLGAAPCRRCAAVGTLESEDEWLVDVSIWVG